MPDRKRSVSVPFLFENMFPVRFLLVSTVEKKGNKQKMVCDKNSIFTDPNYLE